jgi:hypothetical protein
MEMHLTKEMMGKVCFANFCIENGIKPRDAAELVSLAKRAFKVGERVANGEANSEHPAFAAFEIRAKELGFEVSWPGLWPVLMKNGKDVYLPE